MMTAWTVNTNANLFFDKKKENWQMYRQAYISIVMIILVKKKGLCIGLAWLPFQNLFFFHFPFSIVSISSFDNLASGTL